MGGWGRVAAAENSSGWLLCWAHGLFIQRISAGELRAVSASRKAGTALSDQQLELRRPQKEANRYF